MPYIKDINNRRQELRNGAVAQTAGELNYQMFTHAKYDEFDIGVIKNYINNFLGDQPNYQKYNDMIGCIALCCNEVERRTEKYIWDSYTEILENYIKEINNYEDIKIRENGDI